jgi:hypothetical protein
MPFYQLHAEIEIVHVRCIAQIAAENDDGFHSIGEFFGCVCLMNAIQKFRENFFRLFIPG